MDMRRELNGVDLGCGLRRVGAQVGMKYIKTKSLYCSGPRSIREDQRCRLQPSSCCLLRCLKEPRPKCTQSYSFAQDCSAHQAPLRFPVVAP